MRTYKITVILVIIFGSISGLGFDYNGDGLNDVWQHFYGANALDPQGDEDQDGINNLHECWAGTDPFSPLSGLVAGIRCDKTQIALDWVSQRGKSYELCIESIGDGPDCRFLCSGTGKRLTFLQSVGGTSPVLLGGLRRDIWIGHDSLEIPGRPADITDLLSEFTSPQSQIPSCLVVYRGYLVPDEGGLHDIRFSSSGPTRIHFETALKTFDMTHDLTPEERLQDWFAITDQRMLASLEAGQPHAIEIRHVATPEDGLAGAWWTSSTGEFNAPAANQLSAWLPPDEHPELAGSRWMARIRAEDRDSDGDGVSDWSEWKLGYDPYSDENGQSGLADQKSAGLQVGSFGLLTLSVDDAEILESGETLIRVSRSGGDQGALNVPLKVFGTAPPSTYYEAPPTAVSFAAGETEAVVPFRAIDNNLLERAKMVWVEIFDIPGFVVDPTAGDLTISILEDDKMVVEVVAVDRHAYESNGDQARVELRRQLNASWPISVALELNGTATPGADFNLPASVTFQPGEYVKTLSLTALDDGILEFDERVEISVRSGEHHIPHPQNDHDRVYFSDDHEQKELLFLARYAPEMDAETDAWGYATLRLQADRGMAVINTRFDNLTTPQSAAHVHWAPVGSSGPVVESLPLGQNSGHEWAISLVSGYQPADVLEALGRGDLYVNVHSAKYPAGEIRGQFTLIEGGSELSEYENVAQDPGLPGISPEEASRFLQQATMGPKKEEIDDLVALGFSAWLDLQMAVPLTSHQTLIETMDTQYRHFENLATDSPNGPQHRHRTASWWTASVHAPDQLRQRVAFALSQIFVISDKDSQNHFRPVGMANYYDMLGGHAFGNFRDLLEDVTLHPNMGVYLTMIKSQKADPVLGTSPDENFAREIMQLFTIGLFQRHLDGTYIIDGNGLPIETYDQGHIDELSRAFTGWSYSKTTSGADNQNFYSYGGAFNSSQIPHLHPMRMFQDRHDEGEKTLPGGAVIPAGMSGEEDMDLALDILFNHPNTAPFIARLLIQRLTSASPSPGYVYRVAQTFEDNGQGVRGDLNAVVRAILLDGEIRDMTKAESESSGKIKEPVLRLTHYARALDAYSNLSFTNLVEHGSVSGLSTNLTQIRFSHHDTHYGQTPHSALSVFNYFNPDLVPAGPLAAARVTSPEFEILTETTVLTTANFWYYLSFSRIGGYPIPGLDRTLDDVHFDAPPLTDAMSPEDLVAWLNLVFCANSMDPDRVQSLTDRLAEIPNATNRGKAALHLLSVAPEFVTLP